jgi:hypothetical protein
MKTMKKMDDTKPIFYIGDHHGDWKQLFWFANRLKLENCYLISVGDSGIGFRPKNEQIENINVLNNKFKKLDITFMSIRGNHDDPSYYNGDNKIQLDNFQTIEDYTVMEHNGKLIQFIGGATSIDRTMRREGISYWSGESLNFQKDRLQKVDTLVSHTAPSWCFPQAFNEMVYSWAREDADLLEELTDERAVMDEIAKVCQPSLHLYGHFHDSWSEEINGCKHRLLNINEIWGEY